MNWLQAIDTVDATEKARMVFRAMDHIQARGEEITDASIADESKLTIAQVRNTTYLFRINYEKAKNLKFRADIIARHFGKKGRKITG